MARKKTKRTAEQKIADASRSGETKLDLSGNQLTALPESLGQLTQLQSLDLSENQLTALPKSLGQLTQLVVLSVWDNSLAHLPNSLKELKSLEEIDVSGNKLSELPTSLYTLPNLTTINWGDKHYRGNKATDLSSDLLLLDDLRSLRLDGNPLNPELAAAYNESLDAVKLYLRAKAEAQVVLNEAKLILIGEGEVGKSCLLGALRGDPWEEDRPTTHGIEIKPVFVTDSASGTEITLNGWDFGGQGAQDDHWLHAHSLLLKTVHQKS